MKKAVLLLLLQLFLSRRICAAFPLKPRVQRVSPASSTRVFGIRSKAKQKITSFKDKLRPKITEESAFAPAPILTAIDPDTTFQLSCGTSSSVWNQTSTDVLMQETTTLEAREELEIDIPAKAVAFVQLPPLDPTQQLSPAQEEFRDFIAYFERYSQRDMALLKSKRLRVVLEGMAASPLEPAVYKAFEILYQDFLPLRIAGRLIFRRLRQVLKMVVHVRNQELELLQNTTDLSLSTLEDAQFAFFELIQLASDPSRVDDAGINNDREHDLVVPTAHLVQSTWILEDILGSNNVDNQQLSDTFDPEKTGAIDFPQFVLGLQGWCKLQNDDRSLEDLLQQLTHKILVEAKKDDSPRALDPTRQSHSDRFDAMLDAVRKWRTLSANGEGRRWEVLRGCWVGAENEAVRDALRIVYVDVPAMRVSGNTIFALISALIPKH